MELYLRGGGDVILDESPKASDGVYGNEDGLVQDEFESHLDKGFVRPVIVFQNSLEFLHGKVFAESDMPGEAGGLVSVSRLN